MHNNSIWMKPYTRYISKAVFKNLTLCCVPSESIFKNAHNDRLFPNPDFDFHDKNHGNFIFNSTLTPLTGDLTSPKHIINYSNSRISGGHM